PDPGLARMPDANVLAPGDPRAENSLPSQPLARRFDPGGEARVPGSEDRQPCFGRLAGERNRLGHGRCRRLLEQDVKPAVQRLHGQPVAHLRWRAYRHRIERDACGQALLQGREARYSLGDLTIRADGCGDLERGVRPQRRQVLVAGDLAEADDRETDWLDAHSGRGWWCVEVTLPGASAARCGDRLGIGTFRAGGASGFAELV